jgi:FkbM family methyltransferase
VGLYTTKRAMLRPVTAWRRRRASEWFDVTVAFNVAVFEAHDYRPSMRRFFAATREARDLLIDVDLPDDAVVLDVGAFEGEWATRILQRADERGPARIALHAFEPETRVAERLGHAMRDDPRFHMHPYGLAGRDRVEVMTVDGLGTSLYGDGKARSEFGTLEVPLRDVAGVLASLGVERVDLIKINIEGGEYEVLDRLHATGWLPRTGTLIIQFHEFAPGAYRGRRRNRRQLAATHRATWCYPWVYERWDPR